MELGQLIQLGNIQEPIDQAGYLLGLFNPDVNIDDIHPDDRFILLATVNHLLSENKVGSAPCSFETNGKKFNTLENLLNIKVRYFIELVNIDLSEDKFDHFHLVAALIYREDWTRPFDESEVIENATLFYKSSPKFSIWGVEMYSKLITLLRDTYPILYEGKQENKESEGRRAWSMLNGLAKDDPTKWEEAENLELSKAFVWMELKEIQRQNEKK